MLTLEELKEALPPASYQKVDKDFVDTLNQITQDPDIRDEFKNNFVSYTSVIGTGKYTPAQYRDAVMYVTHVIRGESNLNAYRKTFPTKHTDWKAQGKSDKEIHSYVHAYNKGKLVNSLREQTLIPMHILFQDARVQALETQIELMQSSPSDKVRCDAANSVLSHLAPPKEAKIELDIGMKDSVVDSMKRSMAELVEHQRAAMKAGVSSLGDICKQELVTESID